MKEAPSPQHPPQTIEDWFDRLFAQIRDKRAGVLSQVQAALNQFPNDGDLLLLAGLVALTEEETELSARYLKRFERRYVPNVDYHLVHTLTLAQQGRWGQAHRLTEDYGLSRYFSSTCFADFVELLWPWIRSWGTRIEIGYARSRTSVGLGGQPFPPAVRSRKETPVVTARQEPHSQAAGSARPLATVPSLALIPPINVQIPLVVSFPPLESILWSEEHSDNTLEWYLLRKDWAQFSLLQGFDELLCLSTLRDVQTFWFQVETVRRVLKHFRGRVLLADEVGLGKTIEAGMVLKEYLMRGMVESILILTPATMVGQWRDEMSSKFDIAFATSYDSLLRTAPTSFWSQSRLIVSLAAARRPEHVTLLCNRVFDMVIVDEAHHLKNRTSENWKLVNQLKKRFLLLLSATPVQNSMVELYNLLTLLKPGVFKTQKEFAKTYMTPGKPRLPANRERLRDLMRDCMIRNTRALVDVRLPRRNATTLCLTPPITERACYTELNRLVQEAYRAALSPLRLSLRHLLVAAGSSPAAARTALGHFTERHDAGGSWEALRKHYGEVGPGCKEAALLDLLEKEPQEKKIVFVHHRSTLERLSQLLSEKGVKLARFEGSMSGPDKDRAVAAFQGDVPIFLSTESGGEGRNLQFCNVLINFDLPWNPMTIEQRIGRLHRIGQAREVFIFNLVVKETLEQYILRILDEKIHMFELVVGEIGAILGELEETQEFGEMAFSAWVGASEDKRQAAFEELGKRIVEARKQYDGVRILEQDLFGDDLATE